MDDSHHSATSYISHASSQQGGLLGASPESWSDSILGGRVAARGAGFGRIMSFDVRRTAGQDSLQAFKQHERLHRAISTGDISDELAQLSTPLLQKLGYEEDVCKEGDEFKGPAMRQEAGRLLDLAIPLAAQNMFSYSSSFISMGFAGHIGRAELGAAVLGTSIINVTGFAVLAGLASAMETLCGQAFGARNFTTVGTVLQRAMLISLTTLCLMMAVWFNMEPIFLAMGQEATLAKDATRYIILSIPSIMFTGIAECLKRYFMAQGVVIPATICTALSTCLSLLYNYALIFGLGLGLDGAAFANDCVQFTTCCTLGSWVVYHNLKYADSPQSTWAGWTWEAFHGWGAYLRIALPSSAMVCMEWWTFEVMILLSGLLPNPEVSVSVTGICFNLNSLIFMISFGLSGAASTRVSNALGGANHVAAKRTAITAGLLSLCSMVGMGLLVVTTRNHIGKLFSSDPDVIALTASVMPLLALALLGDGLNGVFAGVIRGCGRQAIGATVNLCCYWLLGVPFALWLGFAEKLGVHGFWIGIAATTTLQGTILACVTLSFDWEHEAKRAEGLVNTISGTEQASLLATSIPEM